MQAEISYFSNKRISVFRRLSILVNCTQSISFTKKENEVRAFASFAEFIASILLIFAKSASLGAMSGMGLMGGAVKGYSTNLRFELKFNGRYLSTLCLVISTTCSILLYLERDQLMPISSRALPSR